MSEMIDIIRHGLLDRIDSIQMKDKMGKQSQS